MRKYRVFRRGGYYRVAKPGKWFWHWVQLPAHSIKMGVFKTLDYQVAREKANELNMRDLERASYKKDSWTDVT